MVNTLAALLFVDALSTSSGLKCIPEHFWLYMRYLKDVGMMKLI